MLLDAREYTGLTDATDGGQITPGSSPTDGGERAMRHTPVLVSEVPRFLLHDNSKVILDGTVGAGGHAEAILDHNSGAQLVGVDRDPTALRLASDRLARFGNRVRLIRGVYSDLETILGPTGRIDGVLLDLGVSSMQLDDPDRGFSYRADGNLDMRMGQDGTPAREWIKSADVVDIATALRRNGEVRRAKRIARAMKDAAEIGELQTTGQLASLVRKVLGAGARPAELSRVFQAVRIRVNHELDQLEAFLQKIIGHLNESGRIVVISYHSLEDRAVKSFFKVESATCVCPPGAPICSCAHTPALSVLTRRVVKPSAEEIAANARSRSARLRAAEVVTVGRGQ